MKRTITIILALVMILALAAPAFAANNPVTTDGGTGTTALSYEVGTSFTVTIPESVTLVPGSDVNNNLDVTVTNIAPSTVIKAAITATSGTSNAFTVASGTNLLTYTVSSSTDNNTYSPYTTVETQIGALDNDGTIYFRFNLPAIAKGTPAGNYTGTVTYTIYNEADN